MSQTIDEILERIGLEVRHRNLNLTPDIDATNGAVTPAALPASENLASAIRPLVDIGRFSHVTGQGDQLAPSSTLSVRDFLNVHDQHFNILLTLRMVPSWAERRMPLVGNTICSSSARASRTFLSNNFNMIERVGMCGNAESLSTCELTACEHVSS